MAGPVSRGALLLPLGGFLLLSLGGCVDRDLPTAPPTEKPAYAFAMTGPLVTDNGDADDGVCDATCTLREAVNAAEEWQTITFAEGFAGPIVLSQGPIHIETPMAISWSGAEPLTVDAAQTSPNMWGSVFRIVNGTVLLSGLRITGGNILGEGGGIHVSYGELQLSRSVVTGNSADQLGGGIYSYYSTVTIWQSTISNNTAGYSGGGIDNGMGSTITIERSTISGNTSDNDGGGISNEWGTMLLDRVTVSGNHASQLGGGVACFGDNNRIINSTISGNTAPGYCGGGGLVAMNAFVQLGHSTVTDNEADWGGGIAASDHVGTNVQVLNSIVWGNRNATSPDDLAAELETMGFSSLGYNLVGVLGAGNAFTATGDQVGVAAAELGTLALNEPGATATHALLEGSPAIDAGICTDAAGETVATDQRGVTRPQGGVCDIGAYEVVPAEPPPPEASFGCTARRNAKKGQLAVEVSWVNADPGVTLIGVVAGRTVTKQQAPSSEGTWTTSIKTASDLVSFEVRGGSSRKDASYEWVPAGTACTLLP